MMKHRSKILFSLLLLPIMAFPQSAESQQYKLAFETAYRACPNIPKGLLEAVSFTNTQCHHLTDANYFNDGPDAMPRAYGMMGLVKDGKGYFRENLKLVSELSGLTEQEVLRDPTQNVLAYAKAFSRLAEASQAKEITDCLPIIQQLSELPVGEEKDLYPMQSMLYSVCLFLNDAQRAESHGFQQYHIDLETVFASCFDLLNAPELSLSRNADYPGAIWNPAPECNFSERTKEVGAVVIHYTEGSYAGCISWFKNCDAQVSAHYVIRSVDGQVTQMVREADKAWHARTANGYTIGIEHEAYGDIASYFTEKMYRSSAELVRDICSRYASIDGRRTFCRDTLDNGTCLSNGLHDLGGEGACVKIRGHQHYPDQSHTDPGPYWDWNYYYKLINEGTSVDVLEGEEGRLDHLNYGDDERKIWVIRGPEESVIQLDFSTFGLETDYDFLWIYDGDNVFASKIGRWNTRTPGLVQSSSNVMCVEFRSDCLTTSKGWEAQWRAVVPPPVEPELPEVEDGVFPNPVRDRFTVKSSGDGLTDMVVCDVYGNVLGSARFVKSLVFDASSWSAGVYIVRYGTPLRMEKTVKLVKIE